MNEFVRKVITSATDATQQHKTIGVSKHNCIEIEIYILSH